MNLKSAFYILIAIIFYNCDVNVKTNSSELNKQQVLETEKEFEKMTAQKGWAESFSHFADDSAVLQSEEGIIKGKSAIKAHYSNSKYKDVSLQWDADFVEVAASGDLAYTYGKYTFTAMDTAGKQIDNKGIFHTVWKKQKDGSWKYVWD